jgi:hypothetical protein
MWILFKPKFTWMRGNTSMRSYISALSNQQEVDKNLKNILNTNFNSFENIQRLGETDYYTLTILPTIDVGEYFSNISSNSYGMVIYSRRPRTRERERRAYA